ncbi:U3 small nucleolar RNA-associated protein 25 [Momordica charantia]|uniref:U3 small nucleolar RNA-associated protein 25 n=1 Tax=Momordica charantia TaxID=3673 RepID=A0A6J1BZN8_MOMCH|nr:U3 small nucleolar RNA-associated protein 25 [Momordica charantia]XP_022135101.1 U3 small nucleolar RNA-associated protein 25 [Momordica charantia]
MGKQLVRKRGVSDTEELEVFTERTNYDNLLMQLQSCNKAVAASCMKRQRQEEGKSDTEEDEDGCSESSSALEDEDEEEEEVTDDEFRRSPSLANKMSEPVLNIETEGTEDDTNSSDTDQENELEAISHHASSISDRTSSFNKHMEHKLSKEEAENFLKMKWKYAWVVPAIGMSNCKWSGTGECLLKDLDVKSSNYDLKVRLYEHWLDVYKTSGGTDFHSSRQRFFFSLCNSYRDILYCNKKPFYLKGQEEDSSIMDSYIMHSLNHVFKTRDLITKNDSKVAKHQDRADILSGEKFLDHGFTRPKVLILLPLASIALRVIKRLIHLTPSANKVTVEHLDRLYEDFGNGGVGKNGDTVELSLNDQNCSSKKSSKPSDFQALFGGNNEDLFMIGIKFTRKSIKLFGDFYSSDIIVASPLGLITKLGETEKNKEKDVDYLSSIEVLIIDHADIIAMQNWSHVNTVIEQMNKIPSKQHGTDVMRIRQWYLDGYARFYRQSIVLGFHSNPDINAFFNHYCNNYQGKVRMLCEYKGILPKVVLQVRQVYERFDADSIADVDDARLEYFSKKVFPKINESSQGGVMLFISSYFEFVRVRNFLKAQNASFCLLGEYTKQSDISRARIWFFEGKRKIMLYTERAHFYHRYKIRGIQNLIIYSLPERKEFYTEIVNMLDGSQNMTCRVLFSPFDQLRLERIVGSVPAKRMATSEKSVFVFC